MTVDWTVFRLFAEPFFAALFAVGVHLLLHELTRASYARDIVFEIDKCFSISSRHVTELPHLNSDQSDHSL